MKEKELKRLKFHRRQPQSLGMINLSLYFAKCTTLLRDTVSTATGLKKPSGYRGIIPRHLRASDKMWTTRPMAKRITAKIHAYLIHVLYHYVYITTNSKSLFLVMDGSSFSRQRPIQA